MLGFPFFSSFHALSLADKDLPTCELGRSSNLRFQQKIWHSCINVISSIENASIYQNWSQIRKTLSADKEQTYFVWIRPTHIDFIGRWRKQCSIVCFCCLIFPGHSLWKAKKMNEYHHSFDFTRSCAALRAADLRLLGQDAFRARTFGRFPVSLFSHTRGHNWP